MEVSTMSVALLQRGRASYEFLGELARFSGRELQARSRDYLETHPPEGGFDDADLTRIRQATAILEELPEYQFDRMITRVVAEELYRVGFEAIEDVREAVEEDYRVNEERGGTLELDPGFRPPAYWTDTEFHLTPGGWDGHPRMGYIIHDHLYPYVFTVGGVGAVQAGKSFTDQRAQVAQQGRKDRYRRVLEMGSGTGRFLLALQETYPDAEVHGVEISESGLHHSRLVAARHGYRFRLRKATAEATGYPDGYFDLVGIFTLFHEVPVPATKKIIEESFRILEPGGELVIGDVPPYREQGTFQAAIMDWETEHRGEPFWRASLVFDRAAALAESGFVEVEEYGLGETNYPWVTRGVKP